MWAMDTEGIPTTGRRADEGNTRSMYVVSSLGGRGRGLGLGIHLIWGSEEMEIEMEMEMEEAALAALPPPPGQPRGPRTAFSPTWASWITKALVGLTNERGCVPARLTL